MSQLSAKGRAASMRSSPASVRNIDPATTRSGRLLTRDTTTSPRSPCGLPTRPTSSNPSAPSGTSVGSGLVSRRRSRRWCPPRRANPPRARRVRMAWATRPRRPIMRPMSPGADVDAEAHAAARLIGLDHDGVGLAGEGAGDVVEHGPGAAALRPGCRPCRRRRFPAMSSSVAASSLRHRTRRLIVPVEAGLAHFEPGLNSSQAPEVRRSFSTRSVA